MIHFLHLNFSFLVCRSFSVGGALSAGAKVGSGFHSWCRVLPDFIPNIRADLLLFLLRQPCVYAKASAVTVKQREL
jgi:hypothetical protein